MLSFTQGDNAALTLIAYQSNGGFVLLPSYVNSTGVPVVLTGAVFTTLITGTNGTVNTFGNSSHTIANQTTSPGQFTISLNPTQTAFCGLGENKDIVTEISLSSNLVSYRGQGILTVYPPSPQQ